MFHVAKSNTEHLFLIGKYGEQGTYQESYEASHKNLERRVPDKLFELWKDKVGIVLGHDIFDELVQDYSLLACFVTHAAGVVDNDYGEQHRDCKLERSAAVLSVGNDNKSTDCGGVGTWHSAGAEKPLELEFLIHDYI